MAGKSMKNNWVWSVAVLVAAMAQAAFAAEGRGMVAGPGYFYPEAALDLYYDDNLLSQESDTIDSMVTVASASGREEMFGEASRYAIEIGFDKGWYYSSPQDNYLDGQLVGEVEYFPTSRVTTFLKGEYSRQHEDRGTMVYQGDLADFQDEPDKFDLLGVDAGFDYGLEEIGAPRLELRANYWNREYTNNRLVTRFRDRDEANLGATLKYMIMPATSLLLEWRYTDFHYHRHISQFDSHEHLLLAGITWEATAATAGFAKFGWREKVFDAATREDGGGSAWEAGIEWTPVTYSKLTLSTKHVFSETSGVGNFIDRRAVRVSWKHEWRDYLSSALYVDKASESYEGASRDDDLTGYGLALDYSMNEYLDWRLYYARSERDSSGSGSGLDYHRNQFGLTISFVL